MLMRGIPILEDYGPFLGDTKSVKMSRRKRPTITRDKLGFGEGHDVFNRYTSWVVVRARIIISPEPSLENRVTSWNFSKAIRGIVVRI